MSRNRVSPSFGSLDGADETCNVFARFAGLPGTYRAWLSDDTGSPATRFVRSTGPYVNLRGSVVAGDWRELTSGRLRRPITIAEDGTQVGAGEAWTNTTPAGTVVNPNQSCRNWTSIETSDRCGAVGDPQVRGRQWTVIPGQVGVCAGDGRLYCFQQS